ncbi:MAG: hypothetical protein ACI841_003863 [Planctomycetota bacterium]|jgi:hypothetical protein
MDERNVRVFERLLAGATIREVAQDKSASKAAAHKIKQRTKARLEDLIATQLGDQLGS